MSVRYIVPGERICHSSECIQGSGTYVAGGYVHSSLVGTVQSKNGNEGVRIHFCKKYETIFLSKKKKNRNYLQFQLLEKKKQPLFLM